MRRGPGFCCFRYSVDPASASKHKPGFRIATPTAAKSYILEPSYEACISGNDFPWDHLITAGHAKHQTNSAIKVHIRLDARTAPR
jgi:hypothetical protein